MNVCLSNDLLQQARLVCGALWGWQAAAGRESWQFNSSGCLNGFCSEGLERAGCAVWQSVVGVQYVSFCREVQLVEVKACWVSRVWAAWAALTASFQGCVKHRHGCNTPASGPLLRRKKCPNCIAAPAHAKSAPCACNKPTKPEAVEWSTRQWPKVTDQYCKEATQLPLSAV